jgi:hypothetical protein
MGEARVAYRRSILAAGGVIATLAVLVALLSAPSATRGQDGKAPAGLDHFKCYTAKPTTTSKLRKVTYKDQFGSGTTTVVGLRQVCNPVSKNKGKVINRSAHLVCYATRDVDPTFKALKVEMTNQFGTSEVAVLRPAALCVPSLKRKAPATPGTAPDPEKVLDHFRCYTVEPVKSPVPNVDLKDQFATTNANVLQLVRVCNPVSKNGERVRRPKAHLACYSIQDKQRFTALTVRTRNQFGLATARVSKPAMLCLPSFKKVL